MKLKIYGSGCTKCQQLTKNAEAAATRLGLDYEVEKITDVNAIIEAGIIRTPALMADDEIVTEGKVLDSNELEVLLAKSKSFSD